MGSVDILFRPNAVGLKDKRSVWPPELDKGKRAVLRCVGQRSPTVQMTPSLFQPPNFHTPFPISTLPGDRPPSVQVWLCSMSEIAFGCPAGYHSVSFRTLRRRNQHIRSCPNRFCPNVSCPNLFYLLTILCVSACCGGPCFVRRCFVCRVVLSALSTSSTSCRRQQKILRQYSCTQLKELIPGFLRGCFWAFIFGAQGRWTELWSRLGQARCVGVMAALPQPCLPGPLLHNPTCLLLVHGRALCNVPATP